MAGPTSARPCPTRPATACRCCPSTGPAAVVAAAAGGEPVDRPEAPEGVAAGHGPLTSAPACARIGAWHGHSASTRRGGGALPHAARDQQRRHLEPHAGRALP